MAWHVSRDLSYEYPLNHSWRACKRGTGIVPSLEWQVVIAANPASMLVPSTPARGKRERFISDVCGIGKAAMPVVMAIS
jgi:hypothetical protein